MSNSNQRDYKTLIRKYILVTVDLILVFTALIIYLEFFHHKHLSGTRAFIQNPLWYVLIAGIWIFYSYVFNLYDLVEARKPGIILRNTAIVALLTALTYLFIPFFSPNFPLHRKPAFVLIGYLVLPLLTWRLIFALLFRQPILNHICLVIGTGWQAKKIADALTRDENVYHKSAYRILGFVDLNVGPNEVAGIGRILQFPHRLPDYVRRLGVEELILTFPRNAETESQLYAELVECEQAGVRLARGVDVYEATTGKVMVHRFDGTYFIADAYETFTKYRLYRILNRFMNIIWGFAGSLMALLCIPLVFLANLLFNRGPLFYSQQRCGKASRVFKIYKFRTMIVDAEKTSGPRWSERGDDRITPVGKFLRRTRIDELPQCWNMLKGEMNLIGPRPERPVFVEELNTTIPFFNTRHIVKPGLTGWAQVNYKYGSDYRDALIKLQYDLYYIKHRSFWLDLRIMAATIGVVLNFRGT